MEGEIVCTKLSRYVHDFTRHVARIVSWGRGRQLKWWGGADIFRVLLHCYSLLAMSTVSVAEYTNIVVIK